MTTVTTPTPASVRIRLCCLMRRFGYKFFADVADRVERDAVQGEGVAALNLPDNDDWTDMLPGLHGQTPHLYLAMELASLVSWRLWLATGRDVAWPERDQLLRAADRLLGWAESEMREHEQVAAQS